MDQVQQIKNAVDIVSLIGEKVNLQKSGKNLKGLCPFHSEKTPSFFVTPDLQMYKCFGCGETGDVFTFLQKYENIGFYEALKFFADKQGIKLKSQNQSDHRLKDDLYKLNTLAINFYHYLLTRHSSAKPALNYLTNLRQVKDNTIITFRLGFAPNSGNPLLNFLRKKNIDLKLAETAGLIVKSQNRYFERFHGRIIFPQFDKLGNPVGLAGRLLPEYDTGKTGKYINSPQTPLYNKSHILYGLNIVKDEIKKQKSAIIVEGEVDFLSLYQRGFKNVVAIKGTALTIDQVKSLSRLTTRIILALDSDFAGNAAAKRGIEIAHKENLDIYVLINKNFKDPDEFIKNDPKGFELALNNPIPIWDFLLDNIYASIPNLTNSQNKAQAGNLIAPVLKMIVDPILQADYLKKVARKLDVPQSAVAAKVGLTIEKQNPLPESPNTSVASSRYQILEQKLLSSLFHAQPDILFDSQIQKLFLSRRFRLLINHFLEYSQDHSNFIIKDFAQTLPPEIIPIFSEIILDEVDSKETAQITKELKILHLKQKLTKLSQKIAIYEKKKQKQKLNLAKVKFTNLTKLLKNTQ